MRSFVGVLLASAALAVSLVTLTADSTDIVQYASAAQPSARISITRTGAGTVRSEPHGINCGGICSYDFPPLTRVSLTATPARGSTFDGWGGACAGRAGPTCSVSVIGDTAVSAAFGVSPPPAGRAKLKIKRIKPRHPSVERGKTVRIEVTAANAGSAVAGKTRLCLRQKPAVRNALQRNGRRCFDLGLLAHGKAKTRAFRLTATGNAQQFTKYKLVFVLYAKQTRMVKQTVRVKVR